MTPMTEIWDWLTHGATCEPKPTHMIVVCDTFDHTDYPVYRESLEAATLVVNQPGSMQRVMEVYSYALPLEPQLAEHRAWHLE